MLKRLHRLSLAAIGLITLALAAGGSPARADIPPHLGYGVSIAPHIDVPPGLLAELGADWVLVYDTDQVPQFSKTLNVLYRTDVRGYPTDVSAWERGLADLARQLKAEGVRAVAVGNEPNLVAEWGGQQPNPGQYADVLCRAYRVFKAAAPEIIIVSAGLAPTEDSPQGMNDFTFAARMLEAGAGSCFDAFGYHPYGFNQPPEADPYRNQYSFRRAERMYDLLSGFGIRDRQIWITEFGWVRNPQEDGVSCGDAGGFKDFQWMTVSSSVQADYTRRAFDFADKNWPWAGPMFLWNLDWHMYNSSYEDMCSNLRYFSMLDPHGDPLPVFKAFAAMPKRLAYNGPQLGATVHDMVRVAEAGCAGLVDMGSFTVVNTGLSGTFSVDVQPANGPGVPLVVASTATALSGSEVSVVVDANGVKPGLYLLPINLRTTIGERTASYLIKAWLLLSYPTTPDCVSRFNLSPSQ